ncbi:MAG: carbamoyltransferase [Alphaproteobacteria bacterium]|nr:carbamoyltransferase [Alphaproteobacteria bacterium]
MKILGISPLDKDATVSLIEDGKVLFAAGEERYSRKKHHAGFPTKALADGLRYVGWSPEDIELAAYAFLDAGREEELMTANVNESLRQNLPKDWKQALDAALAASDRTGVPGVPGLSSPHEKVEKGWLKRLGYSALGTWPGVSSAVNRHLGQSWIRQAVKDHKFWQDDLLSGLKESGIEAPLRRFEHHISHAANAYYCSGFDRALILSLDGYGSGLAGAVAVGEGGKMERLHSLRYPHSLGSFYEHVTTCLGYNADRHAGKIVGLAAYGDPNRLSPLLLKRFRQENGDYEIGESFNYYFSRHLSANFSKIDIAAAYQNVLEAVAQELVRYWIGKTGCSNVVLSGGVTANVKMNQRIYEVEGVEKLFVYPNMGDGGCGTGVALHAARDGDVCRAFPTAYLGPDYSESEIEAALKHEGLMFSRPDNLAAEAAKSINEGKVLARFDGRMEYGPRALGNRSVMYHAREPQINQWLNDRLGRTEFMPFAPVTLWEERHAMYENIDGIDFAAQFMTVTTDCKPVMKQNCPAAVHVDGTARPQLIKREVNPGYYDIVQEYQKLTSIPTLINTSFNMHEEPIVCSPADAARAFIRGGLDVLVAGPFLAEKPAAA